jgi:hypothetical protein
MARGIRPVNARGSGATRRRDLLHLLARAGRLPHSGRSFVDHLVGTYRVLDAWGQPPVLCAAGLLHSVYGTEDYPHRLVAQSDRHLVRRVVGTAAERLIYAFCSITRATLWQLASPWGWKEGAALRVPTRQGGVISLARPEATSLVLLECANLAEQCRSADGGPAPWMDRVLSGWRTIVAWRGHLPTRVSATLSEKLAISAYRRALGCRSRHGTVAHLERAIFHCPIAAEPHLLRALCLDSDAEAARGARKGASLLLMWGTPWDKRLPQRAWQSIARRAGTSRDARDYGAVIAALAGAPKPRWLDATAEDRITIRLPRS